MYGFIGEVQGIQAENKTLGAVADGIFTALLRHPMTRDRMGEALVTGLENSASVGEALTIIALVERAGSMSGSLLQRLGDTVGKNQHVRASGAAERIKRIAGTAAAG